MPIHRFGRQSGRGESSGGLSTAEFHVFPAPVFLDMPQEAHIRNIIEFLGQTGAGVGRGGDGAVDGDGDGLRDGVGDEDGAGAGDGDEGLLIYINPHWSTLIRTNLH